MLWTIVAILIILWLLGWAFHVAGSMIHLLLVIAIIVALISLVGGRKTT
ncbi:MAG TPA: lmo0937 family membrane protein [Candidatus Angelobacter sp.]|nr:lmo0937 family membrane protein [Candidatus Angelobacter sp.]